MKYGGKMLNAEAATNNRSDRGVPREVAYSSHPPEGSDISDSVMSGITKIIDMKSMKKMKIAVYSPRLIDPALTVKLKVTCLFPDTLRKEEDAISSLYSGRMITRMDAGFVIPLQDVKVYGYSGSFPFPKRSESASESNSPLPSSMVADQVFALLSVR